MWKACSPPTETVCCARRRWPVRRCAPPPRRSTRATWTRCSPDQPPRTVIWVAGRGTAETAGIDAGGRARAVRWPRRSSSRSEAPPWIGALDVLILAGDDPGDPALVSAAATGVRRGARVVVVAPVRGPAARRHGRPGGRAGAAAAGSRRLRPGPLPGAGLADAARRGPGRCAVDLAALADELDAEALRNSAGRELFTNPAKTLAERMSGRDVVLAGDNAATLALARHGAAVLLRVAHQAVAAVGLADALVALRGGMGGESGADHEESMFHDEQIDGPLPRAVADLRAGHRRRAAGGGRAGERARRRRRDQRRGRAADCRGAAGRPTPGARSSNWRCWPFGWR